MSSTAGSPTPDQVSVDPVALRAALARHWGVLLSFGVIIAGVGIAIIVWPEKTVTLLAVLLGISLLISGVFTLIGSFTQPDQSSGTRVMMAISGAISIVLGLIAFQGVAQAQAVLVLVVGVSWVFTGIVTLVAGVNAAGVPGRGTVIATGVITLVAGAAVLLWPSITLTVLAWIAGLFLVLVGLVQIAGAFQLRSVANSTPGTTIPGEIVS